MPAVFCPPNIDLASPTDANPAMIRKYSIYRGCFPCLTDNSDDRSTRLEEDVSDLCEGDDDVGIATIAIH